MTTEVEPEAVESEHRPAERVLAALMGNAMAITDDGYNQLVEIASRKNALTVDVIEKIEARREALATRALSRMAGTQTVTKRDGIALIDVTGPLVKRADMFSEVSGMTSVETLARDFETAMSDPSIRAVIFGPMNTPGGGVAGIHEFTNQIFAARGRKPVVAYVGELAASAGYWFASACDEIVIDATAEVGSIGARVGTRKSSRSKTMVEATSRRAPQKSLDPESDAGMLRLQSTADAIEAVFFSDVARNRNMTEEAIAAAEGGLLMGQAAVDAGLADRLGSLEALITELGRSRPAAASTNQNRRNAMSDNLNPAENETAITREAFDAITAQLEEVNAKLAQAEVDRKTETAAREKAELAAKTTKANAQVDAWEREGHLTGNATAKVREVYVAACTGQAITAEAVEQMVAALPKFDTTRASKDVPKERKSAEAPTREDWIAHDRGDHAAKALIDRHVKSLVAADKSKNYLAHMKEARAAAMASN